VEARNQQRRYRRCRQLSRAFSGHWKLTVKFETASGFLVLRRNDALRAHELYER
jgi:hypothetical protein